MLNALKQVYYFSVHTNLLIALAAVAQCALTYLILNYTVNPNVLIIEGGTTLLLYNLSLYLSLPKQPASSPYHRTRWVGANMALFWSCSASAAVAVCYALFHLHLLTIGYLFIIGILSVAYAVPIFSLGGKRIGLRQIPGLKLFYIALIWSLSSVGLPVVEIFASGVTIDWSMANYLGLVKIVFLLVCTLPFDIRDIQQDTHYRLKTLPTMLGKERAIKLSYFLGVLHIVVISLAPYPDYIKWGMLLTTIGIILTLRLTIFTTKQHYHHVYLLDFALILQGVVVVLIGEIL